MKTRSFGAYCTAVSGNLHQECTALRADYMTVMVTNTTRTPPRTRPSNLSTSLSGSEERTSDKLNTPFQQHAKSIKRKRTMPQPGKNHSGVNVHEEGTQTRKGYQVDSVRSMEPPGVVTGRSGHAAGAVESHPRRRAEAS